MVWSVPMAENEKTGKKAAAAASRVLKSPKSSSDAKKAAASALSQAPDKARPGKTPPVKKKK